MTRPTIEQPSTRQRPASERIAHDRRATSGEEPGVGELFGKLATETGNLVREEVSLATRELTAKAKAIGAIAATIGAGAVLALVGTQTLAFAAVVGLAKVLPLWLAALSVGGALLGIGAIVIVSARAALARIELTPAKTIETLKENKQWAQRLMQ